MKLSVRAFMGFWAYLLLNQVCVSGVEHDRNFRRIQLESAKFPKFYAPEDFDSQERVFRHLDSLFYSDQNPFNRIAQNSPC
jgi:hypothetical protein